jgi:2-oxoglutarate ferredoxin oxidoreductase subunit beta
VHQSTIDDPSTAFALSRLSGAGVLTRTPIGIFRQVERPTYDDEARAQLATAGAGETTGRDELAGLLSSGDTWSVA